MCIKSILLHTEGLTWTATIGCSYVWRQISVPFWKWWIQSTLGSDDKTVTTRLLENRRSTAAIPLQARTHNNAHKRETTQLFHLHRSHTL